MPKLNNRLPKYCRQSKSSKYAVVYYRGKPHYLGVYGSPESKIAYHRFLAEIQANHAVTPPSGEKNVTICELTAAFLDHAKAQLGHKTANMTRRYSKAQLKIREELALNRRNPFETADEESVML